MNYFLKCLIIISVLLLKINLNFASNGSTQSKHEHPVIEAKVKEAANAEQIIDNMFKPEKNGFLGEGSWSFVWRGTVNMSRRDISNCRPGIRKANSVQIIRRRQSNSTDETEQSRRASSYIKSNTAPSTPIIGTTNMAASRSTSIDVDSIADWKLVALKIGDDNDTFSTEYKMCEELNAIKNQNVEKYGITSLYFRDFIFDNVYVAHGITLLEKRLGDKLKEPGNFSNVNILCALYQAVLTLKYMHGRPKGVIHQDIKPDNIMVRGKRLFIIDYDAADLVLDRKQPNGGNFYWCSIRRYFGDARYYMDDMISLYFTLLDMAGVDLQFPSNMDKLCEMKFNYQIIRNLCDGLYNDIVKDVFLYFHDKIMIDYTGLTYENIVADERIPPYDDICKKALNAIKHMSGLKTAHFVWSTDDSIDEPIPSISSIRGPKSANGWFARIKRHLPKSLIF